jgi:hypothetical protein
MKEIDAQLDWKRETEKNKLLFFGWKRWQPKTVDSTSSNCAIDKEVITSHIWCPSERKTSHLLVIYANSQGSYNFPNLLPLSNISWA